MGKKDPLARPAAPKGGRKRQLNVIYFVDSARTRSFRMPLGRINFLLACISLLMVWSVASCFLLGWVVLDRQGVADRLSDTLATLFEYETRYDGVYDLAYPKDGGGTVPPKERPKRTETEVVAVSSDNADAPKAPNAGTEPGDSQAATNEPAAPTPAESQEDALVAVDSPVIEQQATELRLTFKILNNNTPIRVGGYVWAIAEFKADDGNTRYIASPQAVEPNGKGSATKPKRAHRFSIRRYSRKKLEFPFPKDTSGSFKNIRINIMSRDGEGLAVYDVPVDIRVGASGDENGKKSG